MASMCLPGVMSPVLDWNGEQYGYLDGGVVEKTPILSPIEEHARAGRDQKLVLLCTHFDDQGRIRRPEGFLKRFTSTIARMEDVVWEYQRGQAMDTPDTRIAVLNPQIKYGAGMDFEWIWFNYLWCRRKFKEQLSNAGLSRRFDAR